MCYAINFDLLVGNRPVDHMLTTGMCVEKYRPSTNCLANICNN